MNLLEFKNTLLKYIKDNYPNYVTELKFDKIPVYTTSFLDFDKYKDSFTIFFDFDRIRINQSDDCGDIQEITFSLFIVLRNKETEKLQNDLLLASEGMYKTLKNINQTNLSHRVNVNDISFYNYAEGTNNIVISHINFNILVEL